MGTAPRNDGAPLRLFFICTGNAARSQIAEGLANHLGGGRVEASSAGTMPAGVSSHAVAVMEERGIDISHHHSKGIHEVPGPFDLVITLCDHASLLCPVSVRRYPMEHWSTPDPTFAPGGPEAVHQAFREVRDRLEGQIQDLLDRTLSKERSTRGSERPAAPVRKRSSRR
jgi:arsenate reductase (thioredoxin)